MAFNQFLTNNYQVTKQQFQSNTTKNDYCFGFGSWNLIQREIQEKQYNKCDLSFPIFYKQPLINDDNKQKYCHSINSLPIYQPFSIDELHLLYEMGMTNNKVSKETAPLWIERINIGKEKVYKDLEYNSNSLQDKGDLLIYEKWIKEKYYHDSTFEEMNKKIDKNMNNYFKTDTNNPGQVGNPFIQNQTTNNFFISKEQFTTNQNNPFISFPNQSTASNPFLPNTTSAPQITNPFIVTSSTSTTQTSNPFNLSKPNNIDIFKTKDTNTNSLNPFITTNNSTINNASTQITNSNSLTPTNQNKSNSNPFFNNNLSNIQQTNNTFLTNSTAQNIFNPPSIVQNTYSNPFLTPSKSNLSLQFPSQAFLSNPKVADLLTPKKDIQITDYDKMLKEAYLTLSSKNESVLEDQMKKINQNIPSNYEEVYYYKKYIKNDLKPTGNISFDEFQVYKHRIKKNETFSKNKKKPYNLLSFLKGTKSSNQNSFYTENLNNKSDIIKYSIVFKLKKDENIEDRKDEELKEVLCFTMKVLNSIFSIKEIKDKIESFINENEDYENHNISSEQIELEVNGKKIVDNEGAINFEEIIPLSIVSGFLSETKNYEINFTIKKKKFLPETIPNDVHLSNYLPKITLYKSDPPYEEIKKMSYKQLTNISNFSLENEKCKIYFEKDLDITNVDFDSIKVNKEKLMINIENQKNIHLHKILSNVVIIFKNITLAAMSEEEYIEEIVEKCLNNLKTDKYKYIKKNNELACEVDLKNFID